MTSILVVLDCGKKLQVFEKSFLKKNLGYFFRYDLQNRVRKFLKNKSISSDTPFFISNTFRSNARLKLAKIKQILSNIPRLNFCYLKIIHILCNDVYMYSTMMVICIKQHPSNIWSLIHEKVKVTGKLPPRKVSPGLGLGVGLG